MSNNNDRWSALSLKDRADLMNMYITNGISDLKEMKKHYNSLGNGGNTSDDGIMFNSTNVQYNPKLYETFLHNKVVPIPTLYKNPYFGVLSSFFNKNNPGKTEALKYYLEGLKDDPEYLDRIKNGIYNYTPYAESLDFPILQDIKSVYLHSPQTFNSIDISDYKPKGAEKNIYYKSKILEGIGAGLLVKAGENLKDKKIVPSKSGDVYKEGRYGDIQKITKKGNGITILPGLGHATVGVGHDDMGEYISYYDDWNVGNFTPNTKHLLDFLNESVPIYGRVYLDDYYDIPEEFRGNPFITPAVVTAESKKANGGILNKFGPGGFISKVPKYPEVTIKEESWADAYFKQHPEVAGMAIGEGLNGVDGPRRVIINPYSKNINKDAVLLNERSRHYMEESNFKLPKVTDEQMKKYEGTPYQNDTLNVGRTEAARFISGDKHLLTPEQIEYVNSFSGEEDTKTTNKPLFNPQKIIDNVPAREWIINDNGDIIFGTTGIGTALIHYILSNSKGKKAEELIQQILSTEDKDSELYKDALHYQNHLEALKKYLGTSYDTSVLEESEYKPTIAENKDAKYYKFSSHNNDYYDNVITDLAFQEKDSKQYIDPTLNTFTAHKGRDDKGDYVSIYDTWDYNPTVTGGPEVLNSIVDKVTGGKPFEIYDRIYLDDYYDIPETFRGNPFIAPAIVVDTNAFMETD